MQTPAKEQQTQMLIMVLAIGALGLFLSRYLSSNENRAAQEYVDSLEDNSIPRDNLTMGVVVKDLLNKIKSLEKDKEVNKDKISALQRQASIELEQSKFLTSNVLKSTTA